MVIGIHLRSDYKVFQLAYHRSRSANQDVPVLWLLDIENVKDRDDCSYCVNSALNSEDFIASCEFLDFPPIPSHVLCWNNIQPDIILISKYILQYITYLFKECLVGNTLPFVLIHYVRVNSIKIEIRINQFEYATHFSLVGFFRVFKVFTQRKE